MYCFLSSSVSNVLHMNKEDGVNSCGDEEKVSKCSFQHVNVTTNATEVRKPFEVFCGVHIVLVHRGLLQQSPLKRKPHYELLLYHKLLI